MKCVIKNWNGKTDHRIRSRIIKFIVPNHKENKEGSHFWADKSLLGYFRQAFFIMPIIWVATLGLYTNVHTGDIVPGNYPRLVIGNAALLYGVVLAIYYNKIRKISYGNYDIEKIHSITVGAVSGIIAFFGVLTSVLIGILIYRGEVYDAMEEFSILLLMYSGWTFIMLTTRFSDVCYFYCHWDKKRKK